MKADYDAMDLVNGVLEGFDEAKSHPWTETWASAVPRFWLRCATKFVLAGAIGDSSFLTGRGCHVSSGPETLTSLELRTTPGAAFFGIYRRY